MNWFIITYSPITWWALGLLLWRFVARPLAEKLV